MAENNRPWFLTDTAFRLSEARNEENDHRIANLPKEDRTTGKVAQLAEERGTKNKPWKS